MSDHEKWFELNSHFLMITYQVVAWAPSWILRTKACVVFRRSILIIQSPVNLHSDIRSICAGVPHTVDLLFTLNQHCRHISWPQPSEGRVTARSTSHSGPPLQFKSTLPSHLLALAVGGQGDTGSTSHCCGPPFHFKSTRLSHLLPLAVGWQGD